MRKSTESRQGLPRVWIGLTVCLAVAATLVLTWPTAAHNLDPRSDAVIGHTAPDTNASPWNPIEGERLGIARHLLAHRLGVPAASLELISEQAVNWPDTSLGCGEPGDPQAKVIVPGYRITFAYDGANYEVHTATKSGIGQHLPPVSCEGGIAHDRSASDPVE